MKLDLAESVPGIRRERWPAHVRIRAEAVVALLRSGGEAAAGGVLWVEGGYIAGCLDLRHAQIGVPLVMRNCYFDGPVVLSEARAASVSLEGSRLPSLSGYGMRVGGDVDLSRCHGGPVDVFGASIGGRLWLAGAELDGGGSGWALDAPDLVVDGGIYCRAMRASGGVNLFNAAVGSELELNGATLRSSAGFALRAPGLRVKSDMSCANGFNTTGGVDLFGALVEGQLWLNNAHLDKGTSDCALSAPLISVGGGVYCNSQFSSAGIINLYGAAIGSTLEFDGAKLSNPRGKCLRPRT